jgi:hypothetical protein
MIATPEGIEGNVDGNSNFGGAWAADDGGLVENSIGSCPLDGGFSPLGCCAEAASRQPARTPVIASAVATTFT